MIVISSILELDIFLKAKKKTVKSIGFVPTMGALHNGHIALIEQCCQENDCNIVSIFVNPTQFNNPEDLKKYPRVLDKDLQMISKTKVDVVFNPTVEEMYPQKDERVFDFGKIDKVLEGEFRPGHFNGVAQIVSKLFDIVKPDNAYFGEKDFQQLAVIKKLVSDNNYKVKIIPCATVREEDGLAMSSRNLLLEKKYREIAPIIHKTLSDSTKIISTYSPEEVISFVKNKINNTNLLNVEYFEIVNSKTFEKVISWTDSYQIYGLIAVFAGKVRLIDNIRYK